MNETSILYRFSTLYALRASPTIIIDIKFSERYIFINLNFFFPPFFLFFLEINGERKFSNLECGESAPGACRDPDIFQGIA